MRSKGSRFTLGVWGLRVCSLDVTFTVATICNRFRNRSCEVAMAVPMASSAKGVTFGGSKRRVASFRVASVALRDIQTCFIACQNFCVVFRRWVAFFVAGVALWRRPLSFCVAGAALQTCRAVFCESHCQGCVKWWQFANSMAGVAFCKMWWKWTEASHETSILR